MITLFLLVSAQSVEQFTGALPLTGSAPCPSMDCETGGNLAMSAGADMGGLGALDAVLSAVQGILNSLVSAFKYLMLNVLASEHTSQHTNRAAFAGRSARIGGGPQTGEGGVERAACVPSSISIGAVKIYWHCLGHWPVASRGEVELTSWDSCRCQFKKRRGGGARCGAGGDSGRDCDFQQQHTRP